MAFFGRFVVLLACLAVVNTPRSSAQSFKVLTVADSLDGGVGGIVVDGQRMVGLSCRRGLLGQALVLLLDRGRRP